MRPGCKPVARRASSQFLFELGDEAFGLGELLGGQMKPVAELCLAAQVRFEVKQKLEARHVFEIGERQAELPGFEENVDQIQMLHVGVAVSPVAVKQEDIAGGDWIVILVQAMPAAPVSDQHQFMK